MGSLGYYPYPEVNGKPIDTAEWRDPNNIEKTAYGHLDSELIKAVRKADLAAIDELVKSGADVNTQEKFGFTPLSLSIKGQNHEVISKILATTGVDIEKSTNRGFTPLMVAAWKGDLATAERLLNMKCDKHAKCTGGRNAWGVAHDWHNEEMLELFKRYGLEHKEGDMLAFPPAPKWREDTREQMAKMKAK